MSRNYSHYTEVAVTDFVSLLSRMVEHTCDTALCLRREVRRWWRHVNRRRQNRWKSPKAMAMIMLIIEILLIAFPFLPRSDNITTFRRRPRAVLHNDNMDNMFAIVVVQALTIPTTVATTKSPFATILRPPPTSTFLHAGAGTRTAPLQSIHAVAMYTQSQLHGYRGSRDHDHDSVPSPSTSSPSSTSSSSSFWSSASLTAAALRWSPRLSELVAMDPSHTNPLPSHSIMGEADRSFRLGIEMLQSGQDRTATAAFHEAATLYQCYLDTTTVTTTTTTTIPTSHTAPGTSLPSSSPSSSASVPSLNNNNNDGLLLASEFAHVTALSQEECRTLLAWTCAQLAHLNGDALGDPRAAVRLFQLATHLDPVPSPALWDALGQAIEAAGDEVRLSTPPPSRRDPTAVPVTTTMTETHLDGAIDAYRKAVALQPGNRRALFHLAVALERTGNAADVDESVDILERLRRDDIEFACLVDSWGYVRWHTRRCLPRTHLNVYRGTRDMLELALQQAKPLMTTPQGDGLVCQFGVGTGRTLRMTKEILPLKQPIHGFDPFPDSTLGSQRRPSSFSSSWNLYSSKGEMIPANLGEGSDVIQFHPGLFHDTIRPFWQKQDPNAFLAYAHVACEKYSSTWDVLEALHGRVVPGSILVFDGYMGHPTWRFDEFRAWRESCKRFGWKYEYLAFSLSTNQVVVRVTDA